MSIYVYARHQLTHQHIVYARINLLFVGRKPDRAMHSFTTFGVIELIFHLNCFLILEGNG
jgi:hypothetical protein